MKFILVAFLVAVVAIETSANPKIRYLRQIAQRCPDVCPAVYDPVCGLSNYCIRSFSNSCQLSVFNCNAPPDRQFQQIPNQHCSDISVLSQRC